MKKMTILAGFLFAFGLISQTHASIITYSDMGSYLAAISAPGTDTFDDLYHYEDLGNTGLSRTAGDYSYSVSDSLSSNLYSVGTSTDTWMSTNEANSSLVFNNFSAGVSGFGGLFFTSLMDGSYGLGDLVLTVSDGVDTVIYELFGSTTSSFLGFVSDGDLSSVTITATQSDDVVFWASANNVILGTVEADFDAEVPEPATWALMILGFGLIGAAKRRSKTCAQHRFIA